MECYETVRCRGDTKIKKTSKRRQFQYPAYAQVRKALTFQGGKTGASVTSPSQTQTDGPMFSSGPNQIDAQSRLKEGDLHVPCNIQGTQACDCSITWTAGECFAVIIAMRGASIRMFGHLFVDAEPASD